MGSNNTCSIGIEADDRLRREPPERLNLFFCECCAHRGNNTFHSCLVDGYRIKIPFNDYDRPILVCGLSRSMKVEDNRSLMEKRRLRRIQILWLHVGIQHSTTKCDNSPSLIVDRNDDAISEAIIGYGDVFAGDQQTGFDHVLHGNAERAKVFFKRKALGWCITDSELNLRRGLHATIDEITSRLCTFAGRKVFFEELSGKFHDVVQALPFSSIASN